MSKIVEVRGTIETADGKTSEFSISRDGGWQQWGAPTEVLGDRVDALTAMAHALTEDDLIQTSNDEDEENSDG